MKDRRERKKRNLEIIDQFTKGTRIMAISPEV